MVATGIKGTSVVSEALKRLEREETNPNHKRPQDERELQYKKMTDTASQLKLCERCYIMTTPSCKIETD